MVFELAYVYTSFIKAAACIPVTLILSVIPFCIGILLGTPIAIIRQFQTPVAAKILAGVITCLKGIPAVLLVLLTNYMVLKPIDRFADQYEWLRKFQTMNKIYIGIIALSVFAVIMLSETMRSALTAIDKGQYEAGFSIGLTKRQTLFRIILPQAFPMAMPVLCNNLIGIVKTSSVVYLISINDILNGAKNAANINFRYLEAYIAAALIYWGLCACIERLSVMLERRFKLV